VVDDTTLTVHAVRPLADLPAILCELPIVPRHRLMAVAHRDFRRDRFAIEPLGNGPFVFRERRAGERWIFDRNASFPESMGGAPRVGRTFSFALIFNAARPPFDDVRVRRAVNASLDRARIVRIALAGYGTPATGPVPPEHPFASDDTAGIGGRDDRGAARDLDAAGWVRASDGMRRRDGTPLHFTLLTVGSGDNALEQLVQADLRRQGIAVDIRQMELGAFLGAARATPKQFDALVTGIPGDLSLAHLAGMFDGSQRGGALDYAGFHDAALDAAFVAVREAGTTDEQRTAWRAVQRLLRERVPVAWLYHARGVQGMRRRLQGVRIDLRGELATLAQWSLDSGSAR
jgi:peptide/nickel transport system substrate-binding protein